MTIPQQYPKEDGAPLIAAETTPYPFHPNWWSHGRLCTGYYSNNYCGVTDSLAQLVVRIAHVLRFDPEYANLNSVANHPAESAPCRRKSS